MKKDIYNSPKLVIRELQNEDIITESPGSGNTELPPVWGGAMFKADGFGDGGEANKS